MLAQVWRMRLAWTTRLVLALGAAALLAQEAQEVYTASGLYKQQWVAVFDVFAVLAGNGERSAPRNE